MDWVEEGRRKGGVRDFVCNFDLNERLDAGRDGEVWGKEHAWRAKMYGSLLTILNLDTRKGSVRYASGALPTRSWRYKLDSWAYKCYIVHENETD